MEVNTHMPYIIDAYPNKAQYLNGEEVEILIDINNLLNYETEIKLVLEILYLSDTVKTSELTSSMIALKTEQFKFTFSIDSEEQKNFGVDVSLYVNDIKIQTHSTAFDIVSSWKEAPRYGFLSDFYKEDENDSKDIQEMVKYHLNVIQFYDWMYRHENVMPDQECFVDSLGRELSINAIKYKIAACHQYGMKTLAYGAIYGASDEFFQANKELALYKNNGDVQSFGNWLYIMNISAESPWHEHIINEFKKAIEILGFDGIHLDTYGWPKTAFSKSNNKYKFERLEEHFPALIEKTRNELEKLKSDIGLFFNAVSNWPVEVLTKQDLDSIYIEVWDPCERYIHLYQLISRARELGRKPVLLAAYLSPFSKVKRKEETYIQKNTGEYDEEKAHQCLLLSSAVIFASGGFHFILGELNGVLTNNYYVDHGELATSYTRTVRNYFDFIVRYGNLLFDQQLTDLSMTHANGINDEYKFENAEFSSYGEPNKVWTIVKEKPGFKVINLLNFCGIKSDIWNEGKEKPLVKNGIVITALIDEKVTGIFMASPDMQDGKSIKIDYEFVKSPRGVHIKFVVPKLEVWDLIYIKTSESIDLDYINLYD